MLPSPSRAAGLARLDAFLPAAGRAYAARRNHDSGPGLRSEVSMLSGHLRHRLVAETEVLAAVIARHGTTAAEKFIQEVCWRTYWKGWLELRPAIWQRYRASLAELERGAGWRRAVEGRTGIDCFDAWAQELVETGYLHNHARMWMASLWTHTLRLPWQLGAEWFLTHLIDGDPASNTLSWRWVVGLQTQGKTYLARADNIAQYTGGRFQPTGLAPVAEALPPEPLPSPRRLASADSLPVGPFALLVTEEDSTPDQVLGDRHPAAIAVQAAPMARDQAALPPPVASFVQGALDDTAQRLSAWAGVTVERIALHDAASWAGPLPLVMLAPPVGPVAEAVGDLACHRLRRAWDDAAWPHATRGFFPFRERIPELLVRAGLDQSDLPLFQDRRAS
ncbi:MAG: hypothetical protein EAZ99_00985 [Alphaproteobacteria bacterium]|nr:MAG: hypothetical protein EAZ99_00985 [Alphaproteobacteria bacterium]